MRAYTFAHYEKAWTGLMVSHPRFGGGVIVRVVRDGGDVLVAVRFHDGLRKTFASGEEALRELKSLRGILSAPLDPLDRLSDQALQRRIQQAHRRHDTRCQIDDDLEERLDAAAGMRKAIPRPSAGSAAAWTW